MNNDYNLIEVVRFSFDKHCTMGRLFVNEKFQCYTLEPPLCKFKHQIKPYCIPEGEYVVTLDVVSPKYRNRSPYKKFGGCVPRLLGVPGFTGILIHIGNYPKDTRGCILVGYKFESHHLFYSKVAYCNLWDMLSRFKKPIKILISHV